MTGTTKCLQFLRESIPVRSTSPNLERCAHIAEPQSRILRSSVSIMIGTPQRSTTNAAFAMAVSRTTGQSAFGIHARFVQDTLSSADLGSSAQTLRCCRAGVKGVGRSSVNTNQPYRCPCKM